MTTSRESDNLLPPEIAKHWNVYLDPQSHPRDRFKAAKAAAYSAIKAFEAGERDPERLAQYIEIVAAGVKGRSYPGDLSRARSKMIAVMLKSRGLDDVSTRLAAKKRIRVEVGVIVLADRDLQLPEELELWGSLIGSGQAAICALGEVWPHRCELRVVDGAEPVLPVEDYRAIQGSTEEIVINVPSGTIGCADAGDFDGADSLEVGVEPGHYKVAFFLKKNSDLIAVVAATNAPAQNSRRDPVEL